MDTKGKKVYEVARVGGTEKFGVQSEFLKEFEMVSRHSSPNTRRELQGEPQVRGLYGPMYGGKAGDSTVIRYETPELYRMMSQQ